MLPSFGREALEHSLTFRDLDHTPDDGNRYEVIDGVLYVSPFPTYAHQEACSQLHTILNNHVRSHGLGKVFPAGLKVVLDTPTGVGPDIVFVSTARMGNMLEDGFYGAPDLIVEVLSSKPELDRFVKLHKYAQAGVPHYWIVDPVHKQLVAYSLEGTRYRVLAEMEGEAEFNSDLFPGLTLSLRDLWV